MQFRHALDCSTTVRFTMDMRSIQVELQSFGLRLPPYFPARNGGAGPAEGCTIRMAGRALTVPTQSHYVGSSPYSLQTQAGGAVVCREGVAIAEVEIPVRPHFYDETTPQGESFSSIALLHGADCLASTVYQNCVYWETQQACKFCGIGLSFDRGATVLEKDPDMLGSVAVQAAARDGVRHVTLTTGMHSDESYTVGHLARCAQSITAGSGLPVHVQLMPPKDLSLLDELKQAGVATIGFHLETGDPGILESIAPAKSRCGIQRFMDAFMYGVELFGSNQVSSFIIVGLGEDADSIVRIAEKLCRLGVFPYVLPLRPIPGTPLSSLWPPDHRQMIAIYKRIAELLHDYGLSSAASKAGCVRCGACSCMCLFEKET